MFICLYDFLLYKLYYMKPKYKPADTNRFVNPYIWLHTNYIGQWNCVIISISCLVCTWDSSLLLVVAPESFSWVGTNIVRLIIVLLDILAAIWQSLWEINRDCAFFSILKFVNWWSVFLKVISNLQKSQCISVVQGILIVWWYKNDLKRVKWRIKQHNMLDFWLYVYYCFG